MIPAISTPMTFEEFLAWDDGTGRDFELSDGILEYWIVDYAGLGGVRYICSPKQPTITVYQLHGNEYQPGKFFIMSELIESAIFSQLQLNAAQVFAFG